MYKPDLSDEMVNRSINEKINIFVKSCQSVLTSFNNFQEIYCLPESERKRNNLLDPYELLEKVKEFIISNFSETEMKQILRIQDVPNELPTVIVVGYIVLQKILQEMGTVNG